MFGIMRGLICSQEIKENLGLIVRREFTDLRDSTVKDFERYTGRKLDTNKEVHLPNGSVIMFRHGEELDTLKNINLGWFMIEQAEEFLTDEQFQFLRGRLRRGDVPFHTGFVIGNTAGHNWIWKLWKQGLGLQSEYELIEATTFDNTSNLPKDFIEDLKRLEIESPHHYARYVMNSWEDFEEFDTLIPYQFVAQCINQLFTPDGGYVISCDPAHFGDDETVISALQLCPGNRYKQIYLESYQGKDLMHTAGKLVDLRKQLGAERVSHILIDDIGLGVGLSDRLIEQGVDVVRFKSSEKSIMDGFFNKRSECYWKLRGMLENKLIDLMPSEKQLQQLTTLKFKFKSNGKKYIESKDDAKKRGIKSPDYADCLMMACSIAHFIPEEEKPLTRAELFWQTVKRDVELEGIRRKAGEDENVFRSI
uniref:Putative terminase n=1 Tax=viral metagenome TaxID=1070528 RepID=A0A6M3XUA2_9ZZZZ